MAVARSERRVRVRLRYLCVRALRLAVGGRRPVGVVPAHFDVVRRELADLPCARVSMVRRARLSWEKRKRTWASSIPINSISGVARRASPGMRSIALAMIAVTMNEYPHVANI